MKSAEYYESEMELLRVENGRLRKENEGLKEETEWLCKQVNEWRDAHDAAIDRNIELKKQVHDLEMNNSRKTP